MFLLQSVVYSYFIFYFFFVLNFRYVTRNKNSWRLINTFLWKRFVCVCVCVKNTTTVPRMFNALIQIRLFFLVFSFYL